MKKYTRLISAMSLFAMAVITARAEVTLPYVQSFEAAPPYTDVIHAGTCDSIAGAKLPSSPGNNGLSMTSASLQLDTPVGTGQQWIQIYTKPAVGTVDPSAAGYAGAFYVKNTGKIQYFNGTSWGEAASFPAVTLNQYLGFLVYINYTANEWTLFCNPAGTHNGTMQYVVGPVNYGGGVTEAGTVEVVTGDNAYVDQLAVSRARSTLGVTYDRVAIGNFQYSSAWQDFYLPAYEAAYASGGQNLLWGGTGVPTLLGEDLRSAFMPGGINDADRVEVYQGGAYQQYRYNGSDWVLAVGSIAPSALTVQMQTRLFILTGSARSGAMTYGFFPYDDPNQWAVNNVVNPSNPQAELLHLNGTSEDPQGWTAFQNAMSNRAINGTGQSTYAKILGVNGLCIGAQGPSSPADRLYKQNTPSSAFVEYYWVPVPSPGPSSAGSWRIVGTSTDPVGANAIVPAGAKLWLKRKTSGGVDVTVYNN